MNLLHVDFQELYRRHLCRHSEFGLNVWHLIAVFGVYTSLFGLALHSEYVSYTQWAVAAILVLYFGTLAFNVPLKVLVLNIAIVLGIGFAVLKVPELFGMQDFVPWWAHLILLVLWHRSQVFQHKFYTKSTDMTEFSGKYKKGFTLFVLLAVYELPILLYYLVFDSHSRATA
jgi:hypothetical protein